MPTSDLPNNFITLNTEQTKQLVIVVEIDGVDLITNRPLYSKLKYGDPGIFYGGDGLVYGGLNRVQNVHDIIDLDKASMVIAQRLEPEQGRGAIQQIALTFVDKDQYVTEVIARGPVIPEILGRSVRVWIGYQQSSYPDDYFIVFRGVVTSVDSMPGYVTLQFSDPNAKRREQVCYTPQVPLAATLSPTDTIVAVLNNQDFYQHILGPNGTYDVNGPWNTDGTYNPLATRTTGVRTFLIVEDECIEYGPLGFLSTETAEIQNLKYLGVVSGATGVTVAYTTGGTAGSEVVTVIGSTITVQIQSGVSTANQIKTAILASGPAAAIVTPELFAGSITLQNVAYTFASPQLNDVTISYTSGAPSPTPIVTTGAHSVTVQIQSGITTASAIVAAISSSSAVAAFGITATVTPVGHGPDTQTAPAGPISIGANPQTAPAGPALVALGFDGCLRGARGTTAAAHSVDATVSSAIQLTENAMTLALKMMLSGWNGPWITGVELFSIVQTGDGVLLNQPGAIILPTSIDAVRDYGLVAGDYVTISASSAGNDTTTTITRFGDIEGQANRIIYTADTGLNIEFPTSGPVTAVAAFRSQYDTWPVAAASALTPPDVDVAGHIALYNNWLSDPGDSYRFFIKETIGNLKQFIEMQVYLPVSAYSLTKRGQLSVNITKPPLVQGSLLVLNADNVKEPDKIKISRATNNRKFYNEVDYSYDFDDSGTATNKLNILNTDSLSIIGISVIMPIEAQGVRTDLGSVPLLTTRANDFLTRYKYGAAIVECTTNWEYGVQIEAGDIVALQDDGVLQISNFDTGTRNLGTQLFEVVNRSLDVKSGDCKLQLISGIGLSITDRYAVVSPSSQVVSGDSSEIMIEDSFGAQYPGDEVKKWKNFVGQPIQLHTADYSEVYTATIVGFDTSNNYRIFIGSLSSLPPDFSVLIMDIPPYPNSSSKTLNSMYKALFASFSPTVPIVSGASTTQFDVGAGDVAKFFIGCFVRVEKTDYSVTSGSTEIQVSGISGTTITLASALPFTPDSTYQVTSIGFPDGLGTYRYI